MEFSRKKSSQAYNYHVHTNNAVFPTEITIEPDHDHTKYQPKF